MGKVGKVTLTKEQAKAVEELLEVWSDADIEYARTTLVEEHVTGGWYDPELRAASTIPLDDFITALYIGYEVEKTPEEKVQVLYGAIIAQNDRYDEYLRGMNDGVLETLKALGMKIEGVND